MFQAIAADDLAKALGSLVKVDRGLGHVALDGKRLRGSQHVTSPGVHMLHAFSLGLVGFVRTKLPARLDQAWSGAQGDLP